MAARARRALIGAAALLAGCGTLPAPVTSEGRDAADLWSVFFWTGLAIAAAVITLILWAAVRYRRRDDLLPRQFRTHIPLEIAYTAVPIVIVAALFLLTLPIERRIGDLDRDPATTVHVEAFNWSWRFTYQGTGVSVAGTPADPPQMVLPVGDTVRIVLTADDVIHSFYVRDFLFKRDAIPGRPNRFDLRVEEPGVYRGQCAEYCGLDHWRMRFSIRAVSPSEFRAWLAGERGAGEGAAP